MVTIKSGGGINSNQTVQSRSGAKVEPKSRAIDPASVATIGASTQPSRSPMVILGLDTQLSRCQRPA